MNDTGSVFIRAPYAETESIVNMPWNNWVSLREIGCIPQLPEAKTDTL